MKTIQLFRACALTALALGASEFFCSSVAAAPDAALGFIGTYTGARSKGIYSFRLDSSGAMSSPTLVAETPNPTFLSVHPNQRFLYAANETDQFEGKKS